MNPDHGKCCCYVSPIQSSDSELCEPHPRLFNRAVDFPACSVHHRGIDHCSAAIGMP